MSLLNQNDLLIIEEKAQQILNLECNRAFQKWYDDITFASRQQVNIPDGLNEKLDLFLKENKHLFYRNYRGKLLERIDSIIRESVASFSHKPFVKEVDVKVLKTNEDIESDRNKFFLEVYFTCGRNGNKAASVLKIAKSTFHDWLIKHKEYVKTEAIQRGLEI
jgi:hypothetical protein